MKKYYLFTFLNLLVFNLVISQKPTPPIGSPIPSQPAALSNMPVPTTVVASTNPSNSSGTVLVKKVEAQDGKMLIPYTKYRLHNGLTVLIHEDHSDPIVHVEMTYHVGSNRETPRRTGFAHFFEHMMFQGSQNVADEEHFKMISAAGGSMNGTTNRDRTNYFETIPSNMLETALWLEADRMGFLLPAFTQKKFENQRATVKNEKDQRYGEGYGALFEIKDEIIYPFGHPYSWQTIGYVDDLNEADSNDLKNFFIKWYGPNNAILIISGDVNTEETIKMVEKYFNAIQRGNDIPALPKKPVVLEEIKTETVEAKVSFPLSFFSFPTVPSYHADEPALEILSALLSGSKNSVFYKNFIDDESCLQASCSNDGYEISGEFNFFVVTYPSFFGGLSLQDIKDRMTKSFNEFETSGIDDNELDRIKKAILKSYYVTDESVAVKASILTQYEMLMPDKHFNLQDDIDRYNKVTKADIIRVFKKYIKDRNYANVNIMPHPDANKPGGRVPQYESRNPYKDMTPDKSSYVGLTYNPPIEAPGFDRSKKPVPPAAKPVAVPDFYKFSYDNGVKAIGTTTTENPLVRISIEFEGGHMFETGKIKNGTSALLAEMLNEGTTSMNSKQLEQKLGDLSSSIRFAGGDDGISCNITCYKDKIDETIALFKDMLMNPSFDAKEFKLNKKAMAEGITASLNSPLAKAEIEMMKMLYGKDNPMGIANMSNYKEFMKITIEDLKNFHKNFLSSSLTKIMIVGNADASIKEKLKFIGEWQTPKLTMPIYKPAYKPTPTTIYFVNQPFAKQSNISVVYPTMPYDIKGEYYKATIMNYVLGGNFNSRLNLNLREDKGWTYGIYSGFAADNIYNNGYYEASAGIIARATDSAIVEIIKEMNNYKNNGITPEELEFTKNSLLNRDALRYESSWSKLGFIYTILYYDLDKNFNKEKGEIVKNMTQQEINELAKKWINTNTAMIFVVGDDVVVLPRLKKLGYKIKKIKI